ncbi:DUF6629 family protein [Marimonas lutisalis]|uniref:DUF6629 family protein n=1 Tax=Marimonas lutisalis TaxID=2545756 RepID=UPI0010F79C27|nr:DUF6629 family protein [Marimonas lutisalis]
MCFSATASFTLAGALVPVGAYAMARARGHNRAWLPFAVFPLAFGIQQAFEGLVWLGVEGDNASMVSVGSHGFLFFSHFFWLAWVPFAAWRIESDPRRKRIMGVLTVIGFLYGLSIFLPAFLSTEGLKIEVIQRSLEYRTMLIYEDVIPRAILRVFYAVIVVAALFLSTDRRIQVFGGLILVSLLLTYAFFAYAFISVWCFFAAVLSAYLAVVIHADARRVAA